MIAIDFRLQCFAVLGVCASAVVFLAGAAWQIVEGLVPVFGLFFGGWLLSCVLEPAVGCIACCTRVRRSTAVLIIYCLVLTVLALVWFVAGPMLSRQITSAMTSLPAQVETAI